MKKKQSVLINLAQLAIAVGSITSCSKEGHNDEPSTQNAIVPNRVTAPYLLDTMISKLLEKTPQRDVPVFHFIYAQTQPSPTKTGYHYRGMFRTFFHITDDVFRVQTREASDTKKLDVLSVRQSDLKQYGLAGQLCEGTDVATGKFKQLVDWKLMEHVVVNSAPNGNTYGNLGASRVVLVELPPFATTDKGSDPNKSSIEALKGHTSAAYRDFLNGWLYGALADPAWTASLAQRNAMVVFVTDSEEVFVALEAFRQQHSPFAPPRRFELQNAGALPDDGSTACTSSPQSASDRQRQVDVLSRSPQPIASPPQPRPPAVVTPIPTDEQTSLEPLPVASYALPESCTQTSEVAWAGNEWRSFPVGTSPAESALVLPGFSGNDATTVASLLKRYRVNFSLFTNQTNGRPLLRRDEVAATLEDKQKTSKCIRGFPMMNLFGLTGETDGMAETNVDVCSEQIADGSNVFLRHPFLFFSKSSTENADMGKVSVRNFSVERPVRVDQAFYQKTANGIAQPDSQGFAVPFFLQTENVIRREPSLLLDTAKNNFVEPGRDPQFKERYNQVASNPQNWILAALRGSDVDTKSFFIPFQSSKGPQVMLSFENGQGASVVVRVTDDDYATLKSILQRAHIVGKL